MRADEVAERLAAVRERIRVAGGSHVRVVAVTKGFGPEALVAASAAGADGCGESYAQELVAKLDGLPAPERASLAPLHFIGRLQRNKVRAVAPHVAVWESIDRLSLGAEVARRSPGAVVLVQVNLSGEQHKGGCSFDDAPALCDELVALGLDLRGLMGVGPAGDPERARPGFARLVALADRLGLPERSIGMSADLEVAVSEGATSVRIGSALFGARPQRPDAEPPAPTP